MNIVSFSPFGYEGSIVTVEVDLRRGIPAVDMVGLADSAVKEARERMRSAIVNSGFEFPKERVLISLSPADLKKEGAGFDLAIALSVLLAQKNFETNQKERDGSVLVMGELELSGNVRPVRGVHAALSTALESGVKNCIVCSENATEALGVKGINVYECKTLQQAFQNLMAICETQDVQTEKNNVTPVSRLCKVEFPPVEEGMDFDQIYGLPTLVRGLQIAASGGHNLIAFGPPGCGKTLALQRFPSLLPYLDDEEAQCVTRIYSLAGLIRPNQTLIRKKPFRMPHQSASLEGMCGGGVHCMPGEISLAHDGVLFLDEASEFRTSALQMLRVPLEQKCITLSRAGRHTTYPANFQLLLATNPCPCGNFGDKEKICLCSARSVEQHWKKFSAPLLDRIDIRVQVNNSSKKMISPTEKSENPYENISTQELRVQIGTAIENQKNRQGKLNVHLTPEEINYYCKLNSECSEYLAQKTAEYDFSSRAVHSCIKLARTIADMKSSYDISIEDLQEAIEFRKNEGGLSICF